MPHAVKPVNSKVPGGTLPISTAANARDVYRFRWDGGALLLVSLSLTRKYSVLWDYNHRLLAMICYGIINCIRQRPATE